MRRWYSSWQRYTGQGPGESLLFERSSESQLDILSLKSVDRPGEIDNSDLLQENFSDGSSPELRQMLEEGQDYVLVPQQVWEKIFDWY